MTPDEASRALLKDGLSEIFKGTREMEAADSLDPPLDALLNYIREIELFNPAYKLVGTQDRRELIVKHILDSVSGAPIISQYAPCGDIADAGSGAGLPGIPLAICMPARRFTLIERMGRRAGFLRNTQAVLGLKNVDIEEREIEKAENARFSAVSFRAFTPLTENALKSLFRLLTPDGVLIAYKGRREALEQELAALPSSAVSADIIPIYVPFLEEERHIAVLRPLQNNAPYHSI